MSESKLTDQSVSEIDKALAAAKARKATKEASGESASPAAPKAKRPPGRPRPTEEQKAAKAAQQAAFKAEMKGIRDQRRADKLAARLANKAPAHLKKVARAAERLGTLSSSAQVLFDQATTNLPAADIAVLAAQLNHFNRAKATERALNTRVTAGQSVTITGGDPRFIGKTGTVSKAQRIRAYVSVAGISKPIYVFTSDLTVNAAASQSTATA